MGGYKSISHTKYDCKCHVVFIPMYRKKKLYGQIRQELRRLAEQKESRVLEGHMMTKKSSGNTSKTKRMTTEGKTSCSTSCRA